MHLTDLLRSVNILEIVGSTDREISSIFFDSRQSKVGGIFVALRGVSSDGHVFIPSVLASGSAAVVCEYLPEIISDTNCCIKVADTNEALGILAANFYDNPTKQLKLVGVTGTNGKTTTATSLFHIFRGMGYKVGLFSTIENRIEDEIIPSTHTTPDALQLQSLMRRMVNSGCTHCFMEVSSHAIHQRRISGLNFAGGLFSNLTHDHLDYHKTLEDYYLAKKKFFDELSTTAFCLTNLDDPKGLLIIQDTKAEKYTYSLNQNADFVGKIISSDLAGTSIDVDGSHIASGLRGHFNAYNMLATYSCAKLLGESDSNIAKAFSYLTPVRGRFDVIDAPNGMFGIVDFAHSPDSLLNILSSIRKIIPKDCRIISVLGCGGDRDREKRPIMGAIAYDNSDICIFTSDNPRSEDPMAILSDICSGLPPDDQSKVIVIVDRKEAIRLGCSLMRPRDVILVAGKGHENYQEINGKKIPFDDRIVLNEMLSAHFNVRGISDQRVLQTVPPVGRDQEAKECLGVLERDRALLLYGSPGQGKTVLARHIASLAEARFPDGAFVIDLQNEKQLENILKRIGISLGEADEVDVISLLNERKILVILDSIEGILKNVERGQFSRYLDMLLSALRGSSRVIITSQMVFDKAEVPKKRVMPLGRKYAIELFLRETDDLYVEDDQDEIAEFVQIDLAAHPLSIKIVARYAALAVRVDLSSLRNQWRRQFIEVAAFDPAIDVKSLAASFELCFEGLTIEEQRYFLALALLPDGLLGKHVAEIWASDIASAHACFGILEQRSLLESERLRRRMVGPLLLYAQAKRLSIQMMVAHPLHSVLEEDLVLIDQFNDRMVDQYAPQESDENPEEKNLIIRQFFFNIHASLDRRLEPSIDAQNLAAANSVLKLYWVYHNNLGGDKRTLSTADDAVYYLNKARDIFAIHEQRDHAIQCRYYVGNILWKRGEIDAAKKQLEEVLESPAASSHLKCNVRRAFAHFEYKSGDISRAVRLYKQAQKDADDFETYARCYIGLLDSYRKLEDFESTQRIPNKVQKSLHTLSPSIRGNIIRGMAYANFASGDFNSALDNYQNAMEIFHVSTFGQAHCHRGLGDTYIRLERFAEAEDEFNHAMRLYVEARKERSLGVGLVMIGKARLCLAQNNLEEAKAKLSEVIKLLDSCNLNEPYEQAQAYEVMGQVYIADQKGRSALGYFQLALQQYKRSGCKRPAGRVEKLIANFPY